MEESCEEKEEEEKKAEIETIKGGREERKTDEWKTVGKVVSVRERLRRACYGKVRIR